MWWREDDDGGEKVMIDVVERYDRWWREGDDRCGGEK